MRETQDRDITDPDGSPEAIVADIENRCVRLSTSHANCRIVWRVWGRGPTLLLLHGNYGSWTHWIRNVLPLSRRFRVIVPDMPGFGDSSPPPEPYDAQSIAELLRAGLFELGEGAGEVSIVGFSFGTTIAGALAASGTVRPRRLVIISSGSLGVRRQQIPPFVSWRRQPTAELQQEAHRRNLAMMMISNPDRIDPLAVHLQAQNTRRRSIQAERVTAGNPLREMLFRIDAPIAGIWARNDATIGPYMQDRIELLADAQPGARAVVIPDAGHWVQYEAAEPFNRVLTDLLGDKPGPDTD